MKFVAAVEVEQAVEEMTILLMSQGYELPYLFCVMGINGAVVAARYRRVSEDSDELTADPLTQNIPDEGIGLPVNILFVDTQGEAHRVLIKEPDGKPELIH